MGRLTLLGAGAVVVAASGGGGGTAIWDTTANGGWALSGTPLLTATSDTSNTNRIVRANVSHNSGSYYFEYVVTTMGTYTACGFVNAAHALSGEFMGSNTNGFSYVPNGLMYINSIPYGTAAAFVVGDRIGIAFNITAKRIWVRKNGGAWNNDNPTSGQNPVGNIGGLDTTPMANGPYFPAAFDANTGNVLTANFGQSAYGTPGRPSGYLDW